MNSKYLPGLQVGSDLIPPEFLVIVHWSMMTASLNDHPGGKGSSRRSIRSH